MNEPKNKNLGPLVLLFFQIFAWLAIYIMMSADYSGSDPAGNAMAKGLSYIYTVIPISLFLIVSGLYLLIKESVHNAYKYIEFINLIGLIIFYMAT